MFLGEPHITTKSFRTLKEKVGEEMFKDADCMDLYYVSALSLFKGEHLFRSRKVDRKYKPARYQILLAVRLLMDSAPLPPMNSKEMARRCEKMIQELADEKKTEALFAGAVKIIDELAGPDWDRDSIRTEPITKAIFERFGQTYGRRRHEPPAVAARV